MANVCLGSSFPALPFIRSFSALLIKKASFYLEWNAYFWCYSLVRDDIAGPEIKRAETVRCSRSLLPLGK